MKKYVISLRYVGRLNSTIVVDSADGSDDDDDDDDPTINDNSLLEEYLGQ